MQYIRHSVYKDGNTVIGAWFADKYGIFHELPSVDVSAFKLRPITSFITKCFIIIKTNALVSGYQEWNKFSCTIQN